MSLNSLPTLSFFITDPTLPLVGGLCLGTCDATQHSEVLGAHTVRTLPFPHLDLGIGTQDFILTQECHYNLTFDFYHFIPLLRNLSRPLLQSLWIVLQHVVHIMILFIYSYIDLYY